MSWVGERKRDMIDDDGMETCRVSTANVINFAQSVVGIEGAENLHESRIECQW